MSEDTGLDARARYAILKKQTQQCPRLNAEGSGCEGIAPSKRKRRTPARSFLLSCGSEERVPFAKDLDE